jgi:hypothetical protein
MEIMSNLKKMEQAQAAKRQTLAEWRASRLHELPLPSGLTVTVRDVTMTDLLLTGRLPSAFVDMAEDAAKSGASGVDLKEITKNGAEFSSMLNSLVGIALVEPLIGEFADDTHITLGELPSDDKMAIFNFINREVTASQSFREGQDQPLPPVQHGDGIQPKTEPVLDPRD